MIAAEFQQLKVVEWMLDNVPKIISDESVVMELISKKNKERGNNCLMMACTGDPLNENGVKIVEKLLEKALESDQACSNELPFEVGKSYFIRTVTYHVVGTVEAIKGAFLVLEDASWVADSGKFSTAIANGELSEVEYVGNMIVNTSAIADATQWKHKCPKVTK